MTFANMNFSEVRADYVRTSTTSMPSAGMICWAGVGTAALFVSANMAGTLALYIMMGILPIAFLLDKRKGVNLFSGGDNPLTKLFLSSIIGIGLTVPLVIAAAKSASDPNLVVLGMAILAGIVWIPHGWAVDDKTCLYHAIGRSLGSYIAYAFAPDAYVATSICAVVVVSYVYSLMFMKKIGA